MGWSSTVSANAKEFLLNLWRRGPVYELRESRRRLRRSTARLEQTLDAARRHIEIASDDGRCDCCEQVGAKLVYHDDGSAVCVECAFGLLNTENARLRGAMKHIGSVMDGVDARVARFANPCPSRLEWVAIREAAASRENSA